MIPLDVSGNGSGRKISKFSPISCIWRQIGLKNMNIIFWLILVCYLNSLQFKFGLILTNVFNVNKWLEKAYVLKENLDINIKYHVQYVYTRKN